MLAEAEVWKLVWAVGTEQEKRWAARRIKGAAKEASGSKSRPSRPPPILRPGPPF